MHIPHPPARKPRDRRMFRGGRLATVMATGLLLQTVYAESACAEIVSNVLTPYAHRVDVAVDRGLAYLASVQTAQGFFPGKHGKTAGVVGLCAMAFLSKGHTPGYGEYGANIDKCIDYILSIQNPENGYLGAHDGKMYSHNIATLLLLEVSGMTDPERQKKIDVGLGKAVKVLLAAQQIDKHPTHRGGWRYAPHSNDSDLSCSGWALMALRAARLNGMSVPDKTIENAVAYVRQRHSTQKGSFGYQRTDDYHVTQTGVGLLCLELTGQHGEKSTFRAGNHILNVYHELPKQRFFAYGMYYAAQGMFQLGGKYWERFATWMYSYWLPKQGKDGSWKGKGGRDNPMGHETSYYTAMSVLSFTVPYRQLPIYQRDETVDEDESASF